MEFRMFGCRHRCCRLCKGSCQHTLTGTLWCLRIFGGGWHLSSVVHHELRKNPVGVKKNEFTEGAPAFFPVAEHTVVRPINATADKALWVRISCVCVQHSAAQHTAKDDCALTCLVWLGMF